MVSLPTIQPNGFLQHLRTDSPNLLLFFFQWYGDHRDLHSFPTRRSSDPRVPAAMFVPGYPATAGDDRWPWSYHDPARRSEEHTSELQSRVDLVCRLLL